MDDNIIKLNLKPMLSEYFRGHIHKITENKTTLNNQKFLTNFIGPVISQTIENITTSDSIFTQLEIEQDLEQQLHEVAENTIVDEYQNVNPSIISRTPGLSVKVYINAIERVLKTEASADLNALPETIAVRIFRQLANVSVEAASEFISSVFDLQTDKSISLNHVTQMFLTIIRLLNRNQSVGIPSSDFWFTMSYDLATKRIALEYSLAARTAACASVLAIAIEKRIQPILLNNRENQHDLTYLERHIAEMGINDLVEKTRTRLLELTNSLDDKRRVAWLGKHLTLLLPDIAQWLRFNPSPLEDKK